MNDQSKIIRIDMLRPKQYPYKFENPKEIDKFYMDEIMYQFRQKILELQPDEIINIKDNPFERRYTIDIVIKKYDDAE